MAISSCGWDLTYEYKAENNEPSAPPFYRNNIMLRFQRISMNFEENLESLEISASARSRRFHAGPS